ncbi:hypothetical protein REPUB_Repub11eG0144600 [Reevesia pubescens]
MEHHIAQTQAWRSYLTDISFSQQDQAQAQAQAQAQLLSFQPGAAVGVPCSEPNGSQLDDAGASREVSNGRKRRGRIPTQTPEEKRMKKNEADRKYRENQKAELDKLRAIASRFGGVEKMEHWINQMEAELHRLRGIELEFNMLQQKEIEFHGLEQMKYKFGGIEEMESKLDRFNQIASRFGVIDEIVSEIDRLKNLELQYTKSAQMESNQNQNAQLFFDFPQAPFLSL